MRTKIHLKITDSVKRTFSFFFTQKMVLLFLIVSSILQLKAQVAPVISPSGGFHVDGNLISNNPTTGVGDWVQGVAGSGGFVFNNDGSPVNQYETKLVLDPYDNTTDMIFQGSKFNQDPSQWAWAYGKANGKNDIRNVMYHVSPDNSNNLWVFLASDRFTTSGTSYIDFEFFQQPVTRNNSYGFSSAGIHGGRTINDLVISIEYSNGGSTGTVRFYLWKQVGSGYDFVEQTVPPTIAYAATNAVTTSVPFGAFGSNTYSPYQFAEAAVNISAFFGAIDPCIGINVKTIIVKTKASTSLSANLGDFIEPIQVSLSFATAEINYTNASSLCPSGIANVNLNGVSGGSFSSTPGLIIDPSTGQINLSSSSPGNYTITYSYISNSCPRTTTTSVTILDLPVAPTSANSSVITLCYGQSENITLTALGGSGTTLRWYSGSCNGTLVGSGNNLIISSPSSTTTYYATWENSCGISSCASVTVTVLPQINISSNVTAQISSYNSATGQLTIGASGGTGSYTYSINGGTPQASNVFSGLTAGTYTITVIDSFGCSSTVQITINNALQIIAVDDSGTANGMTGGVAVNNILSNDLLNGVIVNPSLVNLTFVSSTSPNVTLVGNNVVVAPGTPAGTYYLVYQICEISNPTNCDPATVTVAVPVSQIIANNDFVNGVNGYTGGNSVINVFNNDLLNGSPVIPSQVILSLVTPDPNGYITLNPDGTVNVAPNTPAGNYTLTYQICEVLNPTNCDPAIVTVVVTAPQIIANDDNASGINGTTGAVNILNVFTNDLLNGSFVIPAQVILSVVTPDPTGRLTLNPNGSVNIAPNTPGGTYTLTYKICEVLNPTNCDPALVTIQVINTSDVSIVKSQINPSNLPVGSIAGLIPVFPSVITAGTKIYYFLHVENLGPDNSLNATITDMLPAGITNAEYSLNFGNSWFAWGGTRFLLDFANGGVNNVLIRGDLDPNATGTLINTGTIYSATTTDPNITNNESTIVTTINQSANLNLNKQTINSPIVIGGEIIYQVNVVNLGPSVANNVIITDVINPAILSNVEYSLNNGVSWLSPWTGNINIGTLANGASFSLKIKGTIVDATPNPNVDPIPNTATVTSSTPDPDVSNNTETIYTPLNVEADVSIIKSGPATIVAGQQIQYSIMVTNNSNTFAALDVHINDVVNPAIIANAEYSADGGLTWNPWLTTYVVGTLNPLESFTLLIRGTVRSNVITNVINTATVEVDTPDPDITNNTSTVVTTIERIADLEIIKIQIDPAIIPIDSSALFGNPYDLMISPLQITAGDSIYYVLVYTNYGPSDAVNVNVVDILPAGIGSFVASRCQANFGPWSNSGNLGTIIAGGRCLILMKGKVNDDAFGSITNTATISNIPGITDPDLTDNTSTVVTPIISQSDLAVIKSVNNSSPYVGANVTFTVTVTNNGPTAATNSQLVDILPNGYTYVSHTASSGSYNPISGLWNIGSIGFPGSANLTITATVNNPGVGISYLNTASITNLDQFDPDTDNNEDDEITNPVNVIIANDDNAGLVNGYTGAVNVINVFTNDLLNGSPVIPSGLILTETIPNPSGYLTLNPDGSIDVNPGTPAGTHTLTYQICEIINPTNCDDAIVYITVLAPQIIANDDFASVNGYTGGDAVVNVFTNDLLNGSLVIPSQVILTEIVPDPNGYVTLNPDGTVDVASGTPAGTYTLTYQICEVLNPTNCDPAVVTITVAAPQIVANI